MAGDEDEGAPTQKGEIRATGMGREER